VGGAATKVPCGTCLGTISTKAQNSSSCVAKPGCGYKADATTGVITGTACPVGRYNAGGNKQPCTKCPGGLTTSAVKADSIDKCLAPDGYYKASARVGLTHPSMRERKASTGFCASA